MVAAYSGCIPSSLRIWDAASGQMLREIGGIEQPKCAPHQLCFTAAGKRLAGMCDDGRARLWSVETGELVSESSFQIGNDEEESPFGGHQYVAAEFSPDGRFLAAGLGGVFHLYQVDQFKKVRQFGADPSRFGPCMAFSADSKLLLTSNSYDQGELKRKPDGSLDRGSDTLQLWRLADGKEIWRQVLPGYGPAPIAISGDAKRYAVHIRDESNEIRICDMATQKVLRTVKVDGKPRCLRFSADGILFLVGVSDGTAITWDIAGI